jgi:hypothetical protein
VNFGNIGSALQWRIYRIPSRHAAMGGLIPNESTTGFRLARERVLVLEELHEIVTRGVVDLSPRKDPAATTRRLTHRIDKKDAGK